MANPVYPSLKIDAANSKSVVRDGREEDISGDGTTRVRKLHADKVDFEIRHSGLTLAEAATLRAFYIAYGAIAAIDFRWPLDGNVYVVRFGKGGPRFEQAGPEYRTAYVRLVG